MKHVHLFLPIEVLVVVHAITCVMFTRNAHPVVVWVSALVTTGLTVVLHKHHFLSKRYHVEKNYVLFFTPIIGGLIAYLILSRLTDYHADLPLIPPGVTISVIIPARDESAFFIINTLKYLLLHTPETVLQEIIVVDDASAVAVSSILPSELLAKVSLLRLETRRGLIAAKNEGAKAASGTFLLFLDAHCRVTPFYAERLLSLAVRSSFKDVFVPVVVDMEASSFQLTNRGGSRMMFDWSFDFHWIPDEDMHPQNKDLIPVMSGGIFLISRRGFLQGGSYDEHMREWGGENIEQSLRTWMCGGRIVLARDVHVGHVFKRDSGEGRINRESVERNLARAAFVWLDDRLSFFESSRIGWTREMLTDMGPGIEGRLELRHRLGCARFTDFEEKFSEVFENQGLGLNTHYSIQDLVSAFCIGISETKPDLQEVTWQLCDPDRQEQRFHPSAGGTRIRSLRFKTCLKIDTEPGTIVVDTCDHRNPLFHFTLEDDKKLRVKTDSISFLGQTNEICIQRPESIGAAVQAAPCGPESAVIHKIFLGA